MIFENITKMIALQSNVHLEKNRFNLRYIFDIN
jgi:hypothetical protein